MDVAIIDADLIGRKRHRFPNLACMKLSGYHKGNGDNVILKTDYDNINDFDRVMDKTRKEELKMDRKLDGIFMRIKRNEKWCNVCLSDMTAEERQMALSGKSAEWLFGAVDHLADCLKTIGDQFDIVRGAEND